MHLVVLSAMIINSIAFLIYTKLKVLDEDMPNFLLGLFLSIGLFLVPLIHYLIGRRNIKASIYY
jgi:hypothetical protein